MRVLVVALLLISPTFGDDICVPDDYDSIQEAVDNAADGDRILVGPGTYDPIVVDADIELTIASTDGPDETTIEGIQHTIISILYQDDSDILDITLDGFTVTGGTTWGYRCQDGKHTILNCHFTGNDLPGSFGADSTILDCKFTDNDRAVGASGEMRRCIFENTSYDEDEDRAYALTVGSESWVAECVFIGNECPNGVVRFTGDATLIDCQFIDNSGASVVRFETTSSSDMEWLVSHCNFIDNTTDTLVEVLVDDDQEPEIHSCIIWGNDDDDLGDDVIESNNVTEDPLFRDPENGDYRLTADSPARDAGGERITHPLGWDIFGVSDAGAYQYEPFGFFRGDVDGDGDVTPLGDALWLLEWGFGDGDRPPCMDAADVDSGGSVVPLVDALALLSWAFGDADAPIGWDECDEVHVIGCDSGSCE